MPISELSDQPWLLCTRLEGDMPVCLAHGSKWVLHKTHLRDETTVKMDLEATGEQEYTEKHSSPSM